MVVRSLSGQDAAVFAAPGFEVLDTPTLTEVRVPARGKLSVAQRYQAVNLGMALSDVLCLIAALFFSYLAVQGWEPMPRPWLLMSLTAPLVWWGVFRAFHLYSVQHLSSLEQFKATISASSVGIVVVMMVSFWSKTSFSRAWIALTWASVVILELASRKAWSALTARLKERGHLTLRTLIVGCNDEADDLSHQLGEPRFGFKPLGYLKVKATPITANGIPVLGDLDQLDPLVHQHQADCLFVASTAVTPEEMLRVSQYGRQQGIQVKVSANLPEMFTSRLSVQSIGPVMSLSLRPIRLVGVKAILKRIFDFSIAAIVLVLASPVLAATAVAIKLTSPGPVVFKQQRATRGGRFFSIYKFRTMVTDGDRLLREHGIDPSVAFFKLEDDPRITPIGRLIRKLSIDELPQLWNVIRGDMSLVGPRPLPRDQMLANTELLTPRLEVPAGVTGWWQIQGRSEVTPEEALRMDLFYIENWSLALDLYIVLKTAGAVLLQKGAH